MAPVCLCEYSCKPTSNHHSANPWLHTDSQCVILCYVVVHIKHDSTVDNDPNLSQHAHFIYGYTQIIVSL